MRIAAQLTLLYLATSLSTSAAPLGRLHSGLLRSPSLKSEASSSGSSSGYHTPIGGSFRESPPASPPASPGRPVTVPYHPSPDRITQASSSGSSTPNRGPAVPVTPSTPASTSTEAAKAKKKPKSLKQKIKDGFGWVGIAGTGLTMIGLGINSHIAMENNDLASSDETTPAKRSPLPEPMPLKGVLGRFLPVRRPAEPMRIQTVSDRWGRVPSPPSTPGLSMSRIDGPVTAPPSAPSRSTSAISKKEDADKTDEEKAKEKEEHDKLRKVPLVTKISAFNKALGFTTGIGLVATAAANQETVDAKKVQAEAKKANGTAQAARRSENLFVLVPLGGEGGVDADTLRGLGPQQVKPKKHSDLHRDVDLSASPHVYSRGASGAQQIIRQVQMHQLGDERRVVIHYGGAPGTDDWAEVEYVA